MTAKKHVSRCLMFAVQNVLNKQRKNVNHKFLLTTLEIKSTKHLFLKQNGSALWLILRLPVSIMCQCINQVLRLENGLLCQEANNINEPLCKLWLRKYTRIFLNHRASLGYGGGLEPRTS